MTDAEDLMVRVWALAPEDFAAFRTEFFEIAGTPAARSRTERLPRPASFYETFDPEAHDAETEALHSVIHELWIDDLRNLRTEAQVLAREKRDGRPKPPSDYTVFRELFEADHPKPGRTDPPEAHAAWEWDHLDAYYERMESLEQLARHRIEKGAFLARHTEIHRRASQWVDGLFGPATDAAPRPPRVKGQDFWPPVDPEDDLREYGDLDDPDEGPDIRHRRATNAAYARAHDLHCATFGWMVSLPLPRPEDWTDTYSPVSDAASKMESAAEGSFRPANIAATVLKIARTLPLADEALLALDEASGEAWLTPRAHDHLTLLIVAARDALEDRLAEARAHYEALWDVARRVLGSAEDEA